MYIIPSTTLLFKQYYTFDSRRETTNLHFLEAGRIRLLYDPIPCIHTILSLYQPPASSPSCCQHHHPPIVDAWPPLNIESTDPVVHILSDKGPRNGIVESRGIDCTPHVSLWLQRVWRRQQWCIKGWLRGAVVAVSSDGRWPGALLVVL